MLGTYIRDEILLDAMFLQKIQADIAANNIAPGSTLVLAARQVTFGANFTLALSGFNLLILADTLDSGSGGIDVSGSQGSAGKAGPGGTPGGIPGGYGGHGGNGGDGTAGLSASNVTVFCKTLTNLRVLSNGGGGGAGGNGGNGGDGGLGQPYIAPDPLTGYPGQDYIQGGVGGDGGDGGNSGGGGDAGQVTIMFVQDSVPGGFNPKKTIQQNGGMGGARGFGGAGGLPPGTHDNSGGSDGQDGSNGAAGAPANPIIQQVDQTTFFTKIRASFATLAQSWADYRLKVGEFYFRSFRPGATDGVQNFDLAQGEFQSVIALDPQNTDAPQLNTWLLNNRNIFGLPRDLDLLPNFPEYESVVSGYSGLVATVFNSAINMLLASMTVDQKRQDLTAQIASLNDFLTEINLEQNSAAAGLAATKAEQSLAALRQANARSDLSKANQDAQMKMLWGTVLTLGIVTGAVIALGLGGSTLLAALPALLDFGGTVSGDPAALSALSTSESALEKVRKFAGGLKEAVDDLKMVYDIAKLDYDLLNAQADPAILALARQVQESTIAVLAANLHIQQAQYAVNAAQAKLQRAQNDIQRAQTQRDTLKQEVVVLEETARTLISNAQGAMDTLTLYAFYAARSLEIYALTDLQSQIRYDYGYIHPDLEQDLVASDIAYGFNAHGLVKAYSTSWSEFVDVLQYRKLYDQYLNSGNVVSDVHYLTFKDPTLIAAFRQNPDLLFFVDISSVLPNRYETKITSVSVTLVGAQASAPAISCVVEHSGRYTQIKRDGSQIDVTLGPRPAVVQAAKTTGQYSGSQSGDFNSLPFWGRGVASTWHLYVESAEMTQKSVDLSGLTEIDIAIGYNAFFL